MTLNAQEVSPPEIAVQEIHSSFKISERTARFGSVIIGAFGLRFEVILLYSFYQ